MDDASGSKSEDLDREVDERISRAVSENGLELNFGLGYGMVGALDLRLALGYHFNLPKSDNVTMGIYTDFSLRFPYPNSLDWAIVPMLHVHGDIFRASFGLGLGVFSFFKGDAEDYFDDDDSVEKVAFQLKPELRFDWFLSEHVLIGLDFDVPLIFYRITVENDSHDLDHYYQGIKNKTKDTRVQPWLSLAFHVGYKF
jgi:hypothetical protein